MSRWVTAIGLEVHVQLQTRTKIFCGCPVVASVEHALPNSVSCPVCQGQPGVLPAFNRRVKELAVVCALALNCRINNNSTFERKHYYYPDLPKNFQVTQNESPLGVNGWLAVPDATGTVKIPIKKVHMEEDAAKLEHDNDGTSRVDFNRCGVPLLEIVTEAVVQSPHQAYQFLHTLQHLLRWYGVSGANMERGEMRCDANISVRPENFSMEDSVKWELKNLNSIRFVEAALAEAIDTQQFELEKKANRGRPPALFLQQQTFGFDPATGRLKPQRVKEAADDYFYFAEPDLMDVKLDQEDIAATLSKMPGSPAEAVTALLKEGISEQQAAVICAERANYLLYNRLRNAVTASPAVVTAAALEHGVLPVFRENDGRAIPEAEIEAVLQLSADGIVPVNKIRQVLQHILNHADSSARQAAVALGLLPSAEDDHELTAFASRLIESNTAALNDFKNGKDLTGYFTGRVLREFPGARPPAKMVTAIIREILRKFR